MDGIALADLLAARATAAVVLMTGYAVRLEQAVLQRLEVLPKPCEPALPAQVPAQAVRAPAGIVACGARDAAVSGWPATRLGWRG